MPVAPRGCVQRRRRAGNAARDGVAQRPNTKTNGIPDPLQRILAALPSSSVANRCWDSTRPDGFRNAVRIIARNPRSKAYLEISAQVARTRVAEAGTRGVEPRLARSKRAVLSITPHARRPRAELNRLLWLRGPPSCPVDHGGMEDATGFEPAPRPLERGGFCPIELRVRGRRPDLHRHSSRLRGGRSDSLSHCGRKDRAGLAPALTRSAGERMGSSATDQHAMAAI